jgi:outer membrane protein OmpA-like peptidoglycan-associated protein
MRHLALFLLFSILAAPAHAQYRQAPDGFAFRWTMNNFQYPVSNEWSQREYTNGVEVTYIRHVNDFLNFSLPAKFQKIRYYEDGAALKTGEQLAGGLDALFQLKYFEKDRLLFPYLTAGAGFMTTFDDSPEFNAVFPIGLGLNLRIAPHLYLSLESQYRLNSAVNRDQLQHAVGIWIIPGDYERKEEKPRDRDKDGLPDKEDQCPDQPGSVALFGCPDADGDGLPDKLDDCPEEAGLPLLKGCPDADGDNVPDYLDRCPEQAGLAMFQGCPDRDGDRVPDPEDRCPDEPGVVELKGCPALQPEEQEVLNFAKKAVQFETGSAKLLATSFEVLDEIADILAKYSGYSLSISGHTDSVGSKEDNQVLSEQRAESCMNYLVSKGVSSSRISHLGFGETKPVADNRVEAGRSLNRRVEFDIMVR